MDWIDVAKRLGWTVIAAVGGAIGAVEIVDMDAVKAAVMVGLMAAVNFITLLARKQLEG